MGRWAEAFQASIDRRDTADTVDTSSAEPAKPGPSVSSVNSVTRERDTDTQVGVPASDLVSAVSAVSWVPIAERLPLSAHQRLPPLPAGLPAPATAALPPAALPAAATVDLGEPPNGPCHRCGGWRYWRMSMLSGGPGPWTCRHCQEPDPTIWLDGHAVP
jgi:hypothetical protein